MSAIKVLPEGYTQILNVNLKTNKKLFLLINIAAVIVAVVMTVIMHLFIPIRTLFDMSDGFCSYCIRFVSLIILMIAYIVLHELVHGITMKLFGCQKVKYGFSATYAYAGSDEYFTKKSYIIIALAPVVFWGIILAAVNFIVPEGWVWVIYIIQIINISGAAGDAYVTAKFCHLSQDILVKDTGFEMTVYAP